MKANKFKLCSLFFFFWTAYHSVSFQKSLGEGFWRFVWGIEIFLAICIDSLKCKLVSLWLPVYKGWIPDALFSQDRLNRDQVTWWEPVLRASPWHWQKSPGLCYLYSSKKEIYIKEYIRSCLTVTSSALPLPLRHPSRWRIRGRLADEEENNWWVGN